VQAVVGAPTLRITEDFVGGVDLANLFFGLAIVWISIRMMFEDELSIGFFDVVIGDIPWDAEDTVIVNFWHSIGDYTTGLSQLHLDSTTSCP
jgi:hypothetical protein